MARKQQGPSGQLTLLVSGGGAEVDQDGGNKEGKKKAPCAEKHEKGLCTGRGPEERHKRGLHVCGKDPAGGSRCILQKVRCQPRIGPVRGAT